MPRKKNQHYVPQHYLRGWSNDEDYIGVYHRTKGEIPTTHISNVCSKDYLYGRPTHVETALDRLEDIQHRPLESLRAGENLNDLSDSGLRLLLSFIMTQRTRSLYTREDIEAGDHLLYDGIREDMENNRYEDYIEWTTELTEDEKVDRLTDTSIRGVHLSHMLLGILGHFAIQDLEPVILRNLTDNRFVVSDVPSVFDNARFKSQTLAGVAERGLQIYCPIDTTRILLLYDPAVYSIQSNSQLEVLLRSPSVVDELNLLQFHNAEEVILHGNNDVSYLDSLADQIDQVRRRESITQDHEVGGEVHEVDKVPPYQVPKISPSIPRQRIHRDVDYVAPRPESQARKTRGLKREIMMRSDGFPDVAVITAVRFMRNLVEERD